MDAGKTLVLVVTFLIVVLVIAMACGFATSYTFETNIPIPTEIVP